MSLGSSLARPRPARIGRIIAAALCLLLAGACSSVPRRIAPLDVELVSLSLLDATVDRQRFAATFDVRNPNPFEIPIDGVEFSARLSGQGVLIGETFEPVTLPPNGAQLLSAEITSEIVSSFASMLAVVQGPENAIPYELNGALKIASGVERRARFSASGRVPLSSAVEAQR